MDTAFTDKNEFDYNEPVRPEKFDGSLFFYRDYFNWYENEVNENGTES